MRKLCILNYTFCTQYQQDHNQELRSPSTLSLSMIKSRLFLDCMTEDMQADYQCVGVSDRDRIVATTTVKVIRPALRIETQEEELLSQNSIDYKGVNAKAMREVEAIRSGCIEKRMMGESNLWFSRLPQCSVFASLLRCKH